ncbi:alpha/beta fold hydrolase [Hymenobacter nivis]|uniref:Alpha/beta hydrolase n=1 Tax=Hymenobacter nivis TaxID=1850093 RepID=A0A502GTZ6_9BACT|nr:alpha/beta hydrolase [Hymenobacter nivis]TPG64446.1 alpha/beta hydrolase [Hymenobacter nivis]
MRFPLIAVWIGLWTLVFGARPGFAQAPSTPPKAAAGAYFTTFDGLKIYYEVQGQGPPVLLLHGFTGTLDGWRGTPLCTELLAQGRQVVALDLRGNGRSAKPGALAGYEHDAEARDVMGLATALGFAHYQVVGYSRGSIIAARLLVLDPRVTAAVLGGMGEDFTDPQWPRRIAFYKALSGEGANPEFAGFLQSVQTRGLDRQALAWQQQAQPSTSPAALAKIRVPVLVISGAADNDCGSAEALAQLLPAATARRVPGTHDTTLKSAQFAHEVASFLQQHNQKTAVAK